MFVILQMNGPVSSSNLGESGANASKPWEHVWTVEEMRSAAPNWHLSSDVGVSCQLRLILSANVYVFLKSKSFCLVLKLFCTNYIYHYCVVCSSTLLSCPLNK